jgi:hypothetical protein
MGYQVSWKTSIRNAVFTFMYSLQVDRYEKNSDRCSWLTARRFQKGALNEFLLLWRLMFSVTSVLGTRMSATGCSLKTFACPSNNGADRSVCDGTCQTWYVNFQIKLITLVISASVCSPFLAILGVRHCATEDWYTQLPTEIGKSCSFTGIRFRWRVHAWSWGPARIVLLPKYRSKLFCEQWTTSLHLLMKSVGIYVLTF